MNAGRPDRTLGAATAMFMARLGRVLDGAFNRAACPPPDDVPPDALTGAPVQPHA